MGAPKRRYSAEDKAAIVATLAANNGNVKRTARELEVPEQTVRDTKRTQEQRNLPTAVAEAVPVIALDMADRVKTVRDRLLTEIENQVERGELKGSALVTAFGILFDKARILDGLATDRKEVVNTGPSPEELAKEVASYIGRTLAAGSQRDEEIQDAEWSEQADPALPAALLPDADDF